MTVLKRIMLSNVRRFANRVEVPISAQATIILAPNGTGKTALFEAIELALTGGVSRLQSDMFALVRDGERRAEVRLDFGEFEHHASVQTDGSAVQWSGPSRLYGKASEPDIGYLLRLTHLLDQRDRHWFVQEDSGNAGEQLTRLPLGKDAQFVQNQLTALKQAVSKARAERERDAEDARSRVHGWQTLLRRRDEVRTQSGGDLPTLDELAQALQPFADAGPADNLERLETLHSVCTSDNAARLADLRSQRSALQQLPALCKGYSAAVDTASRLAQSSEAHVLAHQGALQTRDAAIAQSTEASTMHIDADLVGQRLVELLRKVEHRDRLSLSLQAEDQALTGERQRHADSLAQQDLTRAVYEGEQAREDAHALWAVRRTEWQQASGHLARTTEALAAWMANVERRQACDQQLAALSAEVEAHLRTLERSDTELADAMQRAAEASRALTTLRQTGDEVRAAVAAIAGRISGKLGDCPVCGVSHGVEELAHRMKAQLEAIDPALRALAAHSSSAREEVVRCERQREDAVSKHRQSVQQRDTLQAQRDTIVEAIEAFRHHPLFQLDNPDGEGTRLATLRNDLDNTRLTLDADLAALGMRPTAERLSQTRLAMQSAAQAAVEAGQVLNRRLLSVDMLRQQLDGAERELSGHESRELLVQQATAQRAVVEARLARRQQSEAQVAVAETHLKEALARLEGARTQWQAAMQEVGSYRERWTTQQLPGNPDQTVLDQTLAALETAIAGTEEASIRLDWIRQQLARLRGAGEFRSVQRRIDDMRGTQSESEHGSKLAEAFADAAAALQRVSEGKMTLETFSNALSKEVAEIHTRLTDIEPLWQSLLERIVREPRFSQTGLQFLRRYNKAHAHVQVPVAGREAPAAKIASEAQKADLQLSFLLSMALAHLWSPWRALLLDDPTQHHDLVHASAVFDVLRDFIVEHGFQTIVTTHDPVQARFFARKLENDGVQVHFLTLEPMDGGVNVRRLGGAPGVSHPELDNGVAL